MKARRIRGRGSSSGRGRTCGRGHKGQNSRSGGGVRPGFEGGQMPLYRRVARRGFSNYKFRKDYAEIKFQDINNNYKDGDTVTLETLRSHNIIRRCVARAKILSQGEILCRINISGVATTRKAAEKIMKAGGVVQPNEVQAEGVAESSVENSSPKK